jgi:hypothetical protein
MAAAGKSEYEIQEMGGWKSDVFLDYARNTTQLFERARRALAKRTFTIQSTRCLNPECATVSQHFQIWPSNGKSIYLWVLSFKLTVTFVFNIAFLIIGAVTEPQARQNYGSKAVRKGTV